VHKCIRQVNSTATEAVKKGGYGPVFKNFFMGFQAFVILKENLFLISVKLYRWLQEYSELAGWKSHTYFLALYTFILFYYSSCGYSDARRSDKPLTIFPDSDFHGEKRNKVYTYCCRCSLCVRYAVIHDADQERLRIY